MDERRGVSGIYSVDDPLHDSICAPGNEPLPSVQVKVPARSVQEEVLSREEIKSVLDDLRSNEEWFYPVLPCGWVQVSGMQK